MIEVLKVCSCRIFLSVIFLIGLMPIVVIGHATEKNDEHTFRHQQHHHRLEQAVNDFKSSQVQWNTSQVSLRHHRMSGGGAFAVSTTAAPPKKHHLRHHNRHHQAWEQRVFPSLHPQTTSPLRKSPAKTSGDNLSSTLQSRFFDRDGLYSMTRTKNDFAIRGSKSVEARTEHGRSAAGRGKAFFGDDDRLTYAAKPFETDPLLKWSESEATRKTLDASADDLDEYYNDDEGWDDDNDDDYSDEEQEFDFDAYDDSRNKIDDRSLPKRRISTVDVEDIYSRSYIPGTLTRHKFEMLGTHEAVKQSRKSHIISQKQHRVLANAHASKVYAEARCRTPKPRVEKIQRDPSKFYVPHCTILHRCGDDTGCCNTDAQTCVPKLTQNVDLYFFVKSLKAKQGTIERHTFINHTECHCVERSKHHSHLVPAMLRKATILDCNCPKLFEKVLQEDGVCRCDCSSGNSGCDWLKRGMEHFSMVDRKCIMEGRCKLPTCEYGSYVKKQGRCPRKDDKLSYTMSFH